MPAWMGSSCMFYSRWRGQWRVPDGPDYWLKYEGTAVGWGGYAWGSPYFTNVYSVQQGAGYSDFQRSAIVESSYYDLKTRQPIWRIVTETKDTEHSDAAKQIAKKIKSQMKSSGL